MLKTGILAVGLLGCTSLFAGTVDLTDGFVIVDGTVYQLGVTNPPGSVDLSAFSPNIFFPAPGAGTYTGLGTITVNLTGGGAHNVGVYFDHDLNVTGNGAFNEYGTTTGAAPAGISWQFGDPNDFSATASDIFTMASLGTLTNANTVGTPAPPSNICCDAAMAESIAVTLAANQSAVMTFTMSTNAPAGGFYLSQFDVPGLTDNVPDFTPGDAVYLQAALQVTTNDPATPEPGTIVLLLSGLGAITYARARRRV